MLPEPQNISQKSNPFVGLSIWGITVIYGQHIKPLKAKHDLKRKRITICSFYPSCSEYGRRALEKHGFFNGWYKTIRRISKCTTYQHEKSCIDYP